MFYPFSPPYCNQIISESRREQIYYERLIFIGGIQMHIEMWTDFA